MYGSITGKFTQFESLLRCELTYGGFCERKEFTDLFRKLLQGFFFHRSISI